MVNILEQKIASKKAIIGVIGMGYIGVSLLDAFGAGGFPLRGYDISEKKIEMLNRKESFLNFQSFQNLFSLIDKKKFKFSTDPAILKDSDILVICVPTSIDRYRIPDLTNLRSAFQTAFSCLKKDQLIILQSSTYPGTTEEDFLPILKQSHLKVGKDFYLAHVPEIADPGNFDYSFNQVPRIISGITPNCLKMAKLLYEQINCPTFSASNTRVAESAKLLQNAFRLINISFINEMKMLFDTMGIDVWEVIEAASTKPFGFMPFFPGPGIGGDCIPIAPQYLSWKAKMTGGPATLMEQACHINEAMPMYVFNKINQGLNRHKKTISGAKILVLGVTYKKDVNDMRESPALKLLPLLKKMQAEIHYNDPHVAEIFNQPDCPKIHLKSVELNYDKLHLYDAVVIITPHNCYDWNQIVEKSLLVIDMHNVTRKIKGVKTKVVKG